MHSRVSRVHVWCRSMYTSVCAQVMITWKPCRCASRITQPHHNTLHTKTVMIRKTYLSLIINGSPISLPSNLPHYSPWWLPCHLRISGHFWSLLVDPILCDTLYFWSEKVFLPVIIKQEKLYIYKTVNIQVVN